MNITIAASAVNAKLVDAPKEVKSVIQELLSYAVEGARFSTAFKDGKWTGRTSFFEWPESKFPAGFVPIVMAKLRQMGHEVRLVRKPLPEPLGPELPIVDAFGHADERYDYQMQVVEKLLRHGQIIAQVATGGGKSRIAKLAFARIKRPTLFLTTRGILMHQMADAMRELVGKNNVGVMGDGAWRAVNGFNVGMVQTFAAALREPEPDWDAAKRKAHLAEADRVTALLAKFEFVILEEAHEASSFSYSEIMKRCTAAHYRLALTGTPFMKDSQEANMRLMAASGPVAIRVTEATLIERGILAKPRFKFIKLDDPQPDGFFEKKDPKGKPIGLAPAKLLRSTPWPRCYEVGVTHAVKRNGIICYEAKRAVEHGLSVMVLVQAQKHGQNLERMLTEAGLRCAFIFGEHKQKERAAAIGRLKAGTLDVLIGSTILDVGVDIPAVGMVIIASGGKAEVAMRQRIGRGLRAKKTGPNLCYIIDFSDDVNHDLRSHARQRRAIIDETPGFAEGVLGPHDDFDFVADGFKRT